MSKNRSDVAESGVAEILAAAGAGDRDSLREILPLLYDELRLAAHRQLRRNRPGQTLDTTALVHEAYLKMADRSPAVWNDQNHFIAIAATAMRYILIDDARRRAADKRGGGAHHTLLDGSKLGSEERGVDLMALDQALGKLSKLSARLGRLVELRFFGGLNVEETAAVMEVSTATVKRDWRKARALLHSMLAPSS